MTGLDDEETSKINFKDSNCLGQEFGESTKTKIAIALLGPCKTDLDDDEMGKINFKNSNCGGREFGESMNTTIDIPPLGR